MSNEFVQNALEWLQDQREANAGSEIIIGFSKTAGKPILATVVSSKGQQVQGTAALESQIFKFVVKRTDLKRYGIKIQRGLSIWYNDARFEVSYLNSSTEYNDPSLLDVVIKAVLKEDPNGVYIT